MPTPVILQAIISPVGRVKIAQLYVEGRPFAVQFWTAGDSRSTFARPLGQVTIHGSLIRDLNISASLPADKLFPPQALLRAGYLDTTISSPNPLDQIVDVPGNVAAPRPPVFVIDWPKGSEIPPQSTLLHSYTSPGFDRLYLLATSALEHTTNELALEAAAARRAFDWLDHLDGGVLTGPLWPGSLVYRASNAILGAYTLPINCAAPYVQVPSLGPPPAQPALPAGVLPGPTPVNNSGCDPIAFLTSTVVSPQPGDVALLTSPGIGGELVWDRFIFAPPVPSTPFPPFPLSPIPGNPASIAAASSWWRLPQPVVLNHAGAVNIETELPGTPGVGDSYFVLSTGDVLAWLPTPPAPGERYTKQPTWQKVSEVFVFAEVQLNPPFQKLDSQQVTFLLTPAY